MFPLVIRALWQVASKLISSGKDCRPKAYLPDKANLELGLGSLHGVRAYFENAGAHSLNRIRDFPRGAKRILRDACCALVAASSAAHQGS